MEIVKIVEVIETHPDKRVVELCRNCKGSGLVWTEIEFGDLPNDSRQVVCKHCDGTGRTSIVRLTVDAKVPYNFPTKGG